MVPQTLTYKIRCRFNRPHGPTGHSAEPDLKSNLTNMEKKTYEQPTAEGVQLQTSGSLLAVSDLPDYEKSDNPWS